VNDVPLRRSTDSRYRYLRAFKEWWQSGWGVLFQALWWLVITAALVIAVAWLAVRSVQQGEGLSQRPNCALVDDAIRKGHVPDSHVLALCRASARGLVYSLTPEDFAALRSRRRTN
jgi:hypothetical protein